MAGRRRDGAQALVHVGCEPDDQGEARRRDGSQRGREGAQQGRDGGQGDDTGSQPEVMRRIVVVGVPGAGKTTLAVELAGRLGIPRVECDALFWGPSWTPTPPVEFRARVAAATAGEAWVTDGNYAAVRDIVW